MTSKEKREYIKLAFRNYITNKRRIEQMTIPGLGGVDYSRLSVVSDNFANGTENSTLKYVDKKRELEKKVEIVRRTLEHYKIEDKKHSGERKVEYIINRWLRLSGYRYSAYKSHISDRTALYWTNEIFFTAEIIAEEYDLF